MMWKERGETDIFLGNTRANFTKGLFTPICDVIYGESVHTETFIAPCEMTTGCTRSKIFGF